MVATSSDGVNDQHDHISPAKQLVELRPNGKLRAVVDYKLWAQIAKLPGPLTVVASSGRPKCGASTFANAVAGSLSTTNDPSSSSAASLLPAVFRAAHDVDEAAATGGVWIATVDHPSPSGEPGTLVILDVQTVDGASAHTALKLVACIASSIVLHQQFDHDLLETVADAAMGTSAAEKRIPVRREKPPALWIVGHNAPEGELHKAITKLERQFAFSLSVGGGSSSSDDSSSSSDSDDSDDAVGGLSPARDPYVNRARAGFTPLTVTGMLGPTAIHGDAPKAVDDAAFSQAVKHLALQVVSSSTKLSFRGVAQVHPWLPASTFIELVSCVIDNLNVDKHAFSDLQRRKESRHDRIVKDFARSFQENVNQRLKVLWAAHDPPQPVADSGLEDLLNAEQQRMVPEVTPLLGLMAESEAADLLAVATADIIAQAIQENDRVARAAADELVRCYRDDAWNALQELMRSAQQDGKDLTDRDAQQIVQPFVDGLTETLSPFPSLVGTEALEQFHSWFEQVLGEAKRSCAAMQAIHCDRVSTLSKRQALQRLRTQRDRDAKAREAALKLELRRSDDRVDNLRGNLLRDYREFSGGCNEELEGLKSQLERLHAAMPAAQRAMRRTLADAEDGGERELATLAGAAEKQAELDRSLRIKAHSDTLVQLELGTVRRLLKRDQPEDCARSSDAILATAGACMRRYEGLSRLMAHSLELYPRREAASHAPSTDILTVDAPSDGKGASKSKGFQVGGPRATASAKDEPRRFVPHPMIDILRGLNPRQRRLLHPRHVDKDSGAGAAVSRSDRAKAFLSRFKGEAAGAQTGRGSGVAPSKRASFGQRATESEAYDMCRAFERVSHGTADDIKVLNAFTPWATIIGCRLLWLLDIPASIAAEALPHIDFTSEAGSDDDKGEKASAVVGDVVANACITRIRAQVDALDHGGCDDVDTQFHSGAHAVLARMPSDRWLVPALEVCLEDVCRLLEGVEMHLRNEAALSNNASVTLIHHVTSVCMMFCNPSFDKVFKDLLGYAWQDPTTSDIACLPTCCALAMRQAQRLMASTVDNPEDWEASLACCSNFATVALNSELYAEGDVESMDCGLAFAQPVVDVATEFLNSPQIIGPGKLSDSVLASLAAVVWNSLALTERRDLAEQQRQVTTQRPKGATTISTSATQANLRSLKTAVELTEAEVGQSSPLARIVHPLSLKAARDFVESVKALQKWEA